MTNTSVSCAALPEDDRSEIPETSTSACLSGLWFGFRADRFPAMDDRRESLFLTRRTEVMMRHNRVPRKKCDRVRFMSDKDFHFIAEYWFPQLTFNKM